MAVTKDMKIISKDFSLRWWWYGLVEDLHLACEKELHDLEEPIRRNVHGLIAPNNDLPHGWICRTKDPLLREDNNIFFCDQYKCLYDSPQHRGIRSRYNGKIFQRRFSFFQPIILTLSGLLGAISLVMQCIK